VSVACFVTPQLGAAPLALAGLMPRSVFRPDPEDPIPALLGAATANAARCVHQDLQELHIRLEHGQERLVGRYASSHALPAWGLLLGLGPLTRAELARALDVTPRTASQVTTALVEAELVEPPAPERPLQPVQSRL